ncbi:DNA repair protein rhp54 [Hordeum vulgare]|nr:DNA repair protein rhp54 [Hordeum vulgare]
MHPDSCNLFDKMVAIDEDARTNRFIIENIIFEGSVGVSAFVGGAGAAAFDLDETPSQDDRPLFMPAAFDQASMDDPFMQNQVDMGSIFPLDHEFLED